MMMKFDILKNNYFETISNEFFHTPLLFSTASFLYTAYTVYITIRVSLDGHHSFAK